MIDLMCCVSDHLEALNTVSPSKSSAASPHTAMRLRKLTSEKAALEKALSSAVTSLEQIRFATLQHESEHHSTIVSLKGQIATLESALRSSSPTPSITLTAANDSIGGSKPTALTGAEH